MPALFECLKKYVAEQRIMKGCEPRDLLNKVNDICLFEGRPAQLTTELIDLAWGNYFGTAHGFELALRHRGLPSHQPRRKAGPWDLVTRDGFNAASGIEPA